MSETTSSRRCPQCGAAIPGEAPHGLCPKCLFAEASIPTETGHIRGAGGKSPPPPRETLAAAFPQLEILELIGQGGMGFVFKARQTKLNRLVALKILPQSLAADPAFAERFTREGCLLARLNHPNIVTVHDFGEAGGFFYLLMEFVDGVNLRQAMRAAPFTPPQALAIVPKICEALQFAHNEGILHRDIKPENVLIDSKGRIKIADFGIAKLLGEPTEARSLTASGSALGTPHYMAPEQLEHPHDVDQRADVYSLGVVFYEMLTGELPIGRFAPPSEKSGIDPRLDDVVLRSLEKERQRRQPSAEEVKTQMEWIAAHAPSPAPPAPPTPPDEDWQTWSRSGLRILRNTASSSRRIFIGVMLGAGIILLQLLIFAIIAWIRTGRPRPPQIDSHSAAASSSSAELVMDQEPLRLAPDRIAAGVVGWGFKSLLPADQTVQWFLVSWNDGKPSIPQGLAAYMKVRTNTVLSGTAISCEAVPASPSGGTDVVQWNFSPGGIFGKTYSAWFSNQPPYRVLTLAPSRLRLQSGRQLVIPLAELDRSTNSPSAGWSGIEFRAILEPAHGPATPTNPNEMDLGTMLFGMGDSDSDNADNLLTFMKQVPEDRVQTAPSDQRLIPMTADPDLREAEAHLADLRLQYTDSHPIVRAQLARVNGLRFPKLPPDLREAIAKWAELTNTYAPSALALRQQVARINELAHLSGLDSSNLWTLIRQ